MSVRKFLSYLLTLILTLRYSVCGCHVLCCCSHRVAIIRCACAAYRQRQSVILFYDTGYLFQIKTQLIHLCGMSIEEAYGQKEKM